ncbi:MAG: M48 family metalloprotease [Verrucomicrobia bacterium]|nr:M48 family metalloprotease [Verrucomicrobiota bacterium]
MDFFERQAKAHRNTKLLVVYFAAAVALIILSVYLVIAFALFGGRLNHPSQDVAAVASLWNPQVFLWVALGTLAVITIGSAAKIMELSQGGSAVAEMLGGQLINPDNADPNERKLLNVVEEMAIASGVPVPQVYLLPEQSINAFAAGHSTSDTVIAVTQGCMKLLSRDELQGVIGHEFSHVLNGDMRLNLRLIGLIFGIMGLAIVGRVLLQLRSRSSRDRNLLPLLGLALLLIGWIGVFFGRLIQSAVSRQREFLADASSVQFTRNPAGLSGALQKIGGLGYGSRIESAHADLASHMFFANGMGETLFGLMETHPPLEERIRAIDPTWDGNFKSIRVDAIETEERAASSAARAPARTVRPPSIGDLLGAPPVVAGLSAAAVRTDSVMPSLGTPSAMHLEYAANFRSTLSEILSSAAHEPASAAALIYSVLLSPDETTRAIQLRQLQLQSDPGVYQEIAPLFSGVSKLISQARLPLLNMTLPTLQRLSPAQYEQFRKNMQFIIESDRQIDLFEYMLQKIVLRHLAPHFGPVKKPIVQYYVLKPLVPDCALLLSALAYLGHGDEAQIKNAFRLGAQQLELPENILSLIESQDCNLPQIDAALKRLVEAAPNVKRLVLNACAYTVAADGVIQPEEAELLRAIADTLDCPIPPFVQGISPEEHG